MANDRLYQLPVEVLVSPTSEKAQLYQEPAEVLVSPTSASAQTYQVPVEVLLVVLPGGSFHLDAVIKATRSSSFTADAVVRRTQTGSFTLDAVLKTTRSGSFSVDAFISVPGLFSFSVDAVLRATRSSSFTLDARVTYWFHLDAVVRKTQAGSFTLDAIKDKATSSSFTLDARARKTQTSSFTVNAERRGLTSFAVNAYIALPLRQIFRDDFNRVTTPLQHLGGPWAWDAYDSFSGDFEQVKAYTDGSNLVMPTQATDWYDSYVGFPMPDTGHAYFDFYVPASWPGNGYPAYGLLFDRANYTGLYIQARSDSTHWEVSQFGSDTIMSITPVPSTWYRAHIAWDGTTATINVWKQSDPEPAGWQYSQPQQFVAYNPATDGPPMLDLYEFSKTGRQDARMDNIEVWTREPHWYGFGGFQVAATIKRTQAASFTLNAQAARGFTLNAFIKKTRFTLDAVITLRQQAVFLVSAQISRQLFTLDAFIRRGGTITANAVLKKTQSSSTTLNAEVFAGTRLRSFKVDALVRRGGSGSWYANAEIRLPHAEHDFSFTADAVLRQPGSPLSLTVDAVIISGLRSGSFTINADSKGQNEKRGTIHLDAVIRQGGSGVFLIGWAVGGNGYFHLDAQIRGWFSLNAEMVASTAIVGSFKVDARITNGRDFRLDAVKRASSTHTFSLGAEIFATGTQGGRYFWLDSWFVQHSGTKSFTLNARIGGGFTLDAFIRPYFTLDAFIHTNAVVIWPPDPGGGGGTTPTDPNGNPLPPDFKASRKYRVVITVGGHDVTGDINWSRTIFTQNAKTNPGTFELVLYGPQPYDGGEDVHVELDGFRTFGGIVLQVERGYVFESDADWPVTTLRGADYNILFDKLITYNRGSADDPSGTYNPYKSFAKGSLDTRIISKVFGSYVDLPAGFDYKLHVTSVGVAAPEKPWAMPTSGSPLRQVMQSLSQVTDAIWWIDPYLRLHYGSRADITAPYPITTGAGGISSRQISMTEDMSQLVTDGFLWGTLAYTVEGEIVMDREQSSYYDSLGPWQYGEFRSDLHHQAYITRRLQSVIQRYGKPIKRAQVVIFEPGYQAGQVAEVILGEHGLDEVLVIRSMVLTFAVSKGPGTDSFFYCVPRFELSIGLDPEEPWDIYDYLPFKGFPFDDPLGWNRCEDCQTDCIDANGGPGGACGEGGCGITDSLMRTVVSGFGISDYGPSWASSHGTGASSSVEGDHGVLFATAALGAAQEDLPLPIPDQFDLTLEFRHEALDSTGSGTGDAPWWALLVTTVSGYQFHVDLYAATGSQPYIQANGDSYTPLTFDPVIGTWYTLRFARDATLLYAKIWASGTTEPGSWLVTTSADNPFAFTGSARTAQVYVSPSGIGGAANSEVWFRNLNIDGLSRCTAVQFEDFNRTVAVGWGSTPSGYTWQTFVSGSNQKSVDGSRGIMTYSASPNTTQRSQDAYVSGPGPWTSPTTYDVVLAFQLPSAIDTTNAGTLLVQYIDGGVSGGQVSLAISSINGQVVLSGGSAVAKTDWVANGNYLLRIQRDPVAKTMAARVWLAGTTEPTTWFATGSSLAGIMGPTSIFWVQWFRGIPNDLLALGPSRTISFDYIEFYYDGKPCYQDCGVLPLSGTRDTFTRTISSGWGTSDGGSVWSEFDGGVTPTSVSSVNGSSGRLYIPHPTILDRSADDTSMELMGSYHGPHSVSITHRLKINSQNLSQTEITPFIDISYGAIDWNLEMGGRTGDHGGRLQVIAFTSSAAVFSQMFGYYLTTGVWYQVRFDNAFGQFVKLKIWEDGTPEPSAWTIQCLAGGQNTFSGGNFALYAEQGGSGLSNLYTDLDVEIDDLNIKVGDNCGVAGGDPSAPGGPCDDSTGETFGAVTSGWGCETITVDGGVINLTGQAARSTLVLYNADTGEHIAEGWFEDQAGKTFRVPAGVSKVIACYRNYAPEIGSNPSIPRLTSPSVGRRNL